MKELKRKTSKQEKGITLVALVITIIILLILAGVALSGVLSENGLLQRARFSAEITKKETLKEEIQFQIQNMQIDEVKSGGNLTHKDVASKLTEELDITAEAEDNEITGEYKGYDYTIDEHYNVTIGDKHTGISIKYELSNKNYTNQDINLTVTATSSAGNITSLEGPESLTKNSDGKYTIKNNGTYSFTAKDDKGNTKTREIKITNIDKLPPKDITLTATEVKSKKFKLKVLVEDAEQNDLYASSGIEKYEYTINNKKTETPQSEYEFTDLVKNTSYTVSVTAYDKAGNAKTETTTVKTLDGNYPTLTADGWKESDETPQDANSVTKEVFDGDMNTSMQGGNVKYTYVYADESLWGKTLVCHYKKGPYHNLKFFYSSGKDSGWIRTNERSDTVEVVIPENTVKILFYFNEGGALYEVEIK